MRKGQNHTAESRAKIAAASKARVTDAMRERGRRMFQEFAEQRRIVWTPEMDKALITMRNAEVSKQAAHVGVHFHAIARRKKELGAHYGWRTPGASSN